MVLRDFRYCVPKSYNVFRHISIPILLSFCLYYIVNNNANRSDISIQIYFFIRTITIADVLIIMFLLFFVLSLVFKILFCHNCYRKIREIYRSKYWMCDSLLFILCLQYNVPFLYSKCYFRFNLYDFCKQIETICPFNYLLFIFITTSCAAVIVTGSVFLMLMLYQLLSYKYTIICRYITDYMMKHLNISFLMYLYCIFINDT